MNNQYRILGLLLAIGLLSACSDGGGGHNTVGENPLTGTEQPAVDEDTILIPAGDNIQDELVRALFEAQPGNVIELPEGEFQLDTPLAIDTDNITLRGQGHEKTVLNFGAQASGGESVRVRSNNVVLEDFAVVDPPSDGIKSKQSNGITMRRVRVEWTCGACEENGAYGLYPVESENVLIEDSVVIGASDAGVYVGQSDKIIVRRNRASLNVAGIEIENSTNSEVYENTATDNTGGILVFDLPNLPREGARSRVYNNVVRGNNTPNFAPKGNIVGTVPTGTGMLIMAFEDVEVFDNIIEDHMSAAIVVVHYDVSGFTTDDPDYNGAPKRIHIHDNQYSNNGYDPQDIAAGVAPMFASIGGLPQIVYDGIGESEGRFGEAERICVKENTAVTRGIIFGASGASVDAAYFDCAHASLPAVELDTPEKIAEGERPLTAEEIVELCTPNSTGANFAAIEVNCPTLSGYNLFAETMEPRRATNGGIAYDLTTPLFTDYAAKYRFIFVPEGKQVAYSTLDALDFPVGTIIAKTFTMPNDFLNEAAGEEIIETRLLIHRKDGWAALPYIWREDRTGADLSVAGGTRDITWIHSDGRMRSTSYGIPAASSCKTCHSTVKPETGSGRHMETVIDVIGPKARFLNRDNVYGGETRNQLEYMAELGVLIGLPDDPGAIDTAPDWEDTSVDLESRAKAYLDINCAHCHNPTGFASNSALFLEFWREVDTAYGICKTPVAAGSGSGGLNHDIVPGDPDTSILAYRMDSNEPDVRMPEIGRTMVHDAGVELVREWISSLSGGCE